MITVFDRTLKAAGLEFAAAKALLKPAAGELVVHIKQELDGPPVPQSYTVVDDLPGVSDARSTDFESVEHTNTGNSTPTKALPASANDVDIDRLQRRANVHANARQSAAAHLGLRLPDDARGTCFADIARVARALGASATLLPGGSVRLESQLGHAEYASFAAACTALNARAFNP